MGLARAELGTLWAWPILDWTLGLAQTGLDTSLWAWPRLDWTLWARPGLDWTFLYGPRVSPASVYVDCERYCMTVFLLSISCDIVEN